MKLKISFVIIFSLILLSACKKEKVGGPCEYVEVTKKMSVTFIDGEIDSDFMISFQPAGVETDEVYRIESKKLNNIKTNFEFAEFQNRDNVFDVTIDEITKGSCVPFVVTGIKLVN